MGSSALRSNGAWAAAKSPTCKLAASLQRASPRRRVPDCPSALLAALPNKRVSHRVCWHGRAIDTPPVLARCSVHGTVERLTWGLSFRPDDAPSQHGGRPESSRPVPPATATPTTAAAHPRTRAPAPHSLSAPKAPKGPERAGAPPTTTPCPGDALLLSSDQRGHYLLLHPRRTGPPASPRPDCSRDLHHRAPPFSTPIRPGRAPCAHPPVPPAPAIRACTPRPSPRPQHP